MKTSHRRRVLSASHEALRALGVFFCEGCAREETSTSRRCFFGRMKKPGKGVALKPRKNCSRRVCRICKPAPHEVFFLSSKSEVVALKVKQRSLECVHFVRIKKSVIHAGNAMLFSKVLKKSVTAKAREEFATRAKKTLGVLYENLAASAFCFKSRAA